MDEIKNTNITDGSVKFQNYDNFFLVVAPGLEDLALLELNKKIDLLTKLNGLNSLTAFSNKVSGGIEVTIPFILGCELNRYLKIPSRILLRVGEFKCTHYDKIEKGISKISWNQFLRDSEIQIKVSYKETKLNYESKIIHSVKLGLNNFKKRKPLRKSHLDVIQSIFVKIKKDMAVVSIDTSGELLYKRGYKINTVEAPLRETIAASMYFMAESLLKNQPKTIVDPMCGAGTLSFESLLFWSCNRSRFYAFENFPYFSSKLESNKEDAFKKIDLKKSEILKILMNDIDLKSLEAAKSNSLKLNKKTEFTFQNTDFINLKLNGSSDYPLWIFLNPPYDMRLTSDKQVLTNKLKNFLDVFKPNVISLIWPGQNLPKIGVNWKTQLHLKNGGIPVVMGLAQVT